MQARGPLMIEHRLIERVVALMERTVAGIESTGEVDALLVDAIVDFIATYADRTHHGKEEDILFRELDKKHLSEGDRTLMEQLLEDHRVGRTSTRALADARARYCSGDDPALADVVAGLKALIALYPQHIEKEDKVFFPGTRKYLSDEEDQAMLEEFWEFDRRMIHDKYRAVIERLQA